MEKIELSLVASNFISFWKTKGKQSPLPRIKLLEIIMEFFKVTGKEITMQNLSFSYMPMPSILKI